MANTKHKDPEHVSFITGRVLDDLKNKLFHEEVERDLSEHEGEENMANTFYDYLAQQIANEVTDEPTWYFAIDAKSDIHFPRGIHANNDGFARAFNYIYFKRHVHHDVIDAMIECWQEYYKDATGRYWSEWVNDNSYISLDEDLGEIDIPF